MTQAGNQPGASRQSLHSALRESISQAVPLWNAGDYEGCAAIYLATARSFADENQTLKTTLDRALSAPPAGSGDDSQGWILRRAFDSILARDLSPEPEPDGDTLNCRDIELGADSASEGGTSDSSDEEFLGALGPCGAAMAFWRRLNQKDFKKVELFEFERKQLARDVSKPMAVSSMRVLCWRRTLLQWACCFYFIKLVMEVIAFERTVEMLVESQRYQVVFGVNLGDYARFFQGFLWIEGAWALFLVLIGVMAQVYSIKSALQWRSYYKSVKLLTIAWAAVCGLPWLWAILEPIVFNLALDVRGIQQQACEDIIKGSVEGLHSVVDLVSPGVGNFTANAFSDIGTPFAAHLGTKLCARPPHEVFETLSDDLNNLGLGLDQVRVDNVTYVLRIIFAERTWEVFFGIFYISKSRLLMLFPTLFGLMFGAFKGSHIVRTIVPYSRIPGLILLCATVFTAPFLIVLVVTANAIIGNIWLLVGMLLGLAAVVFSNLPLEIFGFKVPERLTLMVPASHESVEQGNASRRRLKNALYLLAGIFLIIGFVLSDVWRTKFQFASMSIWEILQDPDFWSFVFVQLKFFVLNFFLTYWTITNITQVCFTDWALCLVLLIDGDGLQEHTITRSLSSESLTDSLQEQKRKVLGELSAAF